MKTIIPKELLDWLQKTAPEKKAVGRYARTDIGNGNLFADWARNLARYNADRGVWYVYNGRFWEADAKGAKVRELCKKLADGLLIYSMSLPDSQSEGSYKSHVIKWQSQRQRETILKDAFSVYPVYQKEFDANPNLFNCKNGTLDLETFQFHKHNPTDMLTKISGVKYVPGAHCARWEQFVSEVMQGDEFTSTYLQKALGYGLTGEAPEECFFILYGPTTRNGKSTLMESYMKLLGDYGRTASAKAVAQKAKVDSGAPTEEIARLAGARVVNIPEPDKQLVLSSALVKTLTGRDTITARYLHENSFEFKPQFKLFINTNYLPKITDGSVFSSGRVKVIPFERHFSEKEQDKTLKKKLIRPDSLSGILNWCLDGLKLMRERGLEVPPKVRSAIETYQHSNDKTVRFMEDELEYGIGYEARAAEVYTRYQRWCGENGQYPESKPNFYAELESHKVFIQRKRPKGGGEKTSLLLYYRLRPLGVNMAFVATGGSENR